MTTYEYNLHLIAEYTILKKAHLNAGDFFLAEYYENLIKEKQKEVITLVK